MHALPSHVQSLFLNGQHTMRHIAGTSNPIWSDMYIETAFMRYGLSKGGLTGITFNGKSVKIWALNLHICSQLIRDLACMRDDITEQPTHHKEETTTRIEANYCGRKRIKEMLEQCVDPLDPNDQWPSFNFVQRCFRKTCC